MSLQTLHEAQILRPFFIWKRLLQPCCPGCIRQIWGPNVGERCELHRISCFNAVQILDNFSCQSSRDIKHSQRDDLNTPQRLTTAHANESHKWRPTEQPIDFENPGLISLASISSIECIINYSSQSSNKQTPRSLALPPHLVYAWVKPWLKRSDGLGISIWFIWRSTQRKLLGTRRKGIPKTDSLDMCQGRSTPYFGDNLIRSLR